MFAKIINDVVEKYPYSINELRRDNPNVSFPVNLTTEQLEEWDVFSVIDVEQPIVDHTQDVSLSVPTKINGVWTQTWAVVDVDEATIEYRTKEKAESVRDERNKKLSATDWTQLIDSPFSNDTNGVWQVYRQALRDVPTQQGFPWNVIWPSEPN
jgi:hypothetical protein